MSLLFLAANRRQAAESVASSAVMSSSRSLRVHLAAVPFAPGGLCALQRPPPGSHSEEGRRLKLSNGPEPLLGTDRKRRRVPRGGAFCHFRPSVSSGRPADAASAAGRRYPCAGTLGQGLSWQLPPGTAGLERRGVCWAQPEGQIRSLEARLSLNCFS